MSNVIPVAATVNTPSSDLTIGASGRITFFITDSDGGFAPPDCQVNIQFKAASNQYMRQAQMGYDNPSATVYGAPGLVVRALRVTGNVGVDAVGQV